MKVFLLLSIVVAVALAAEEKYTTKYDNMDLDEIMKSDRLLMNYFNCIMDKGPCTPEGSELKSAIPDALKSECSKCSEKQKEGAEKVIKYLKEHKPDLWHELEKKYDPEGIYEKKYHDEAEKHGIKV